jgi:hypothetical protein
VAETLGESSKHKSSRRICDATAAQSSCSNVVGIFCPAKEPVADTLGGVPNHWDALFEELARWEEVLSSLPDVSDDAVDVTPEVDDPPD